ncbi:LRR domain containing protein [Parasponia andersonii]|uniref:LRR domain containing protein n=1 Tax=Parasponia andersonii TaxID=3476 RepID=A0A2P5CB29_PARAD|nr:LRR domain containing protein [Parasponia andersonii]
MTVTGKLCLIQRGSIPDKIGDMSWILSLDISRNQLSGELPTSLSKLNFLSHLNVSYNNFSGEIPLSTQLQSMEASSFIGNQLCGPPLPKDAEMKIITQKVEMQVEEKRAKKKTSTGFDWE